MALTKQPALLRVCVFCGSNSGRRPEYAAAGRALGEALARRGCSLVYGGAKVGVMGAVADSVLRAGGKAVGVIPKGLVTKEVAHRGLTELKIVDTMHERKQVMADLSDAFVCLAGGVGTLDEFSDMFTWAQLGIHAKPIGLVNTAGYYDPLIAFMDRATEERFISEAHRRMLLVAADGEALLDLFETYRPPKIDKWIDRTSA